MEVKSIFHSKNILVFTDFGDPEESCDWWEKTKGGAKLIEKALDFLIWISSYHPHSQGQRIHQQITSKLYQKLHIKGAYTAPA
jgi:hypothetical protein